MTTRITRAFGRVGQSGGDVGSQPGDVLDDMASSPSTTPIACIRNAPLTVRHDCAHSHFKRSIGTARSNVSRTS